MTAEQRRRLRMMLQTFEREAERLAAKGGNVPALLDHLERQLERAFDGVVRRTN